MGIHSAGDAEESLSLLIEVIGFNDEFWSSLDLYLPSREYVSIEEFRALLSGIKSAEDKIIELIAQLEEDDDEDGI